MAVSRAATVPEQPVTEQQGPGAADDLDRAASTLRELLDAARRRIWLHTRCSLLNALPPLTIGESMTRVARRTRHASLRLLIDDPLELKQTQPQLARTVTRLTTAIEVRRLEPAEDVPASLLLIVDRGAWLYLVQHKGRVGLKAARDDPAGARIASERFAEGWAIGAAALELRNLML